MSLATTCPACGTCFRVVQDQLKVSGGWVRCGHCHDVFNALEGLFELDSPPPPTPASRTLPPPPPASVDWGERTQPLDAVAPDLARAIESRLTERTLDTESEQSPAPVAHAMAEAAVAPPGIEAGGAPDVDGDSAVEHDAWLANEPSHVEPVAEDAVAADPPTTVEQAHSTPIEPTFDIDSPQPTVSDEPSVDELSSVQEQDWTTATATSIDTGTAAGWVSPHEPVASMAQFLIEEQRTDAGGADADQREPDPLGAPLDAERVEEAAALDEDVPAGASDAPDIAPINDMPLVGPPAVPAPTVSADEPTTTTDLPSFVRRVDQRARWERPGTRALLGTAAALLAMTMIGQVAWHSRNRLAYAWPSAQPMLERACEAVGCELQAPRLIDALVVDNTTLTRPPGMDGYRLAVTLHNRAEHPVAPPTLMLELSDGQGVLLVRRVLQPQDIGTQAQEPIGAQADTTWTVDFTTTERRVAGYSVAAFYP